MIVARVLLSGFKLTPTSLGAGPSCSTFEVAVPSEPQTPRARSRSTQDARDRLHQDHRLRVPASVSLSEDRTHYTGDRCPGVSTRCQSPRTSPALTAGPGPVASVRRRAALESLWRLAPFELPRGETPDVDVELVHVGIAAAMLKLDSGGQSAGVVGPERGAPRDALDYHAPTPVRAVTNRDEFS